MAAKDEEDRKGPAKPAGRREREAAALRENLKRRKAQTRARAEPPSESSADESDGGD